MAKNSYYSSGQEPKSSILKSTFISRLSALFGYRVTKNQSNNNLSGLNLSLVNVDLNNPSYRFKQAALGSVFDSKKLSTPLEEYFNAYLDETMVSYSDIQDRQKRLNELSFLAYNDCFCGRCVELTASEATQLDVQDRLISIESPDISFVNRCYELFNLWGLTQQRVQGVCWDLELYGESFWAHKIGLHGVEKIIPIRPNTIIERLEFSGVHMAEYLSQRDGYQKATKNRKSKISALIDLLSKTEDTFDLSENIADLFDNKLFGYELHDGIIVPPWTISHFRYNNEHSEFYPYGRPPLLNCLAPFKQMYSTMMLQGLARSMSFPVTLYKVKATEGMGPAIAFEHVNTVREEYDNLGLTPASAGGEVYTVNTKVWIPDGILDIDVKESKCDIDFVGDLELYQDRVAIASGIPKSYLDQEFGGFGNSGIALTEQYKPYARHVYTIQSAFLDGLGDLIRLHFAITGEFDYNTPFLLKMAFPAEEMSQEKREARMSTLEMAQSIMDLITTSLGIEDGEPLPDDVIIDILSKYSFLNPTDINKWLRKASVLKSVGLENEENNDENFDSDFESDFGSDFSNESNPSNNFNDNSNNPPEMEEPISNESISTPEPEIESRRYNKNQVGKILRERSKFLKSLKEKQKRRLKEISTRYKETKEDIFFHYLECNHLQEYNNSFIKKHIFIVPKVIEGTDKHKVFEFLRNNGTNNYRRLQENESMTIPDMMYEIEKNQYTETELKQNQQIEEMALKALRKNQKFENELKEDAI